MCSSVKAGKWIFCHEAYAASLSWTCSACFSLKLLLFFTWAPRLAAHPSHHVRIKRVWPRVMTSLLGNWGMFSHFLIRRVSSSVNDPTLIGLSLWKVHKWGQIRVVTLITEIITPVHKLLLNSLKGSVEILCDLNTTDACESDCENRMTSSFNDDKKESRFSQLCCAEAGWGFSLLKKEFMEKSQFTMDITPGKAFEGQY